MSAKKIEAKAKGGSDIYQAKGNIYNYNGSSSKNQEIWMPIDWGLYKKMTERPVTAQNIRDFIEGNPHSWRLVFQEKTVLRPQTEQILEELQNRNIIAVLGAGAEGKSTILRQVAAKLLLSGTEENPVWDIYFVELTYRHLKLDDIPPQEGRPRIFIVDNAPLNQSFASFLQAVEQNETDYLLFAGRTNEWRTYINNQRIDTRGIYEIEISLDGDEVDAFADYLIAQGIGGEMSRDELISLFQKEKSNGYLYSSMLMALHNGIALEQVVDNIMQNLEKQASGKYQAPVESVFMALSLVCIIEECGKKCDNRIYQEYCDRLEIPRKEIFRLLEKEVQRIGSYVETRHPTISRLFADWLYGENGYFYKDDIIHECFDYLLEYISSGKERRRRNENSAYDKLESLVLLAAHLPDCEDLKDYIFLRLQEAPPYYDFIQMMIAAEEDLTQREEMYIRLYEAGFANNSIIIMFSWAELEIELGNIGNVDTPNTARWVLRNAFKNIPNAFIIANSWAKLEIGQDNIGSVDEENTARWILCNAFQNTPDARIIAETWAKLEIEQNNIGRIDMENSARWILCKAFKNNPASEQIAVTWANLEIEQNNIGNADEENSARWILCNAFKNNPASEKIAVTWAKLEIELENIGNADEENSARWIMRNALTSYPASLNLATMWANLEIEQGNIGNTDEENSARRILYNALKNGHDPDQVAITWANLEIEQNNIGGIDIKNSARWILYNALENGHDPDQVAIAWTKLEIEQDNIGNIDVENSARWILCKAFKNNPASEKNAVTWANLEIEQGNIGNIDMENSARWILCKAFKNNPASKQIAVTWANLEIEQNNIGNIDVENSARWVLYNAFKNNPASKQIAVAWANLEIEQNNIGSIDVENSARWILCKAFKNNPASEQIAVAWANLEIEQNSIGNIDVENSARWVLYNAFKNNPASEQIAVAWANLEIEQDNIGNIDVENSARWILCKALKNSNEPERVAVTWSDLETQQGNIGNYTNPEPYTAYWIYQQIDSSSYSVFTKTKAHLYYIDGHEDEAVSILIDSLSYNYGCINMLCEMQARQGAFSPELPYGVPELAEKMLNTTPDKEWTLYWLYLCYAVWGSEDEAQRYRDSLIKLGADLSKLYQGVIQAYELIPYYEPLIEWMKAHPEECAESPTENFS